MEEVSRAFLRNIHTLTPEMIECPDDKKWMREALAEARKGVGLTSPNPPVGAVIVKNGSELARGWHQKAGMAHAERDALSKLSSNEAQGATIYVTLEPCSTQGRTGSCTSALIKAGVSRVVYAIADPNPSHQGRSDFLLKEARISVTSGILEDEAAHLIRGFTMVQREGRPWVIAKTAMSLDGRITRPPNESQWLTSREAREKVQLLRAEVDGIITSGETVRQDDPELTLRSEKISSAKKQPLRAVMTRTEMKYDTYRIFNDEHRKASHLYFNFSPKDVLQDTVNKGCSTVLLESGGELMGAFLDAGFIDEFVIFYAPIVTGGSKPGIGGTGAKSLDERFSLKKVSLHQVGPDLCLRAIVSREGKRPLER